MVFNPLSKAIEMLKDNSFFDILLPMILVFVIFYAILANTEILGSNEKKYVKAINAIISFIVGFLFITQTNLVSALNKIMGKAAFLLVVTLLILVLLAFTGIFKKDYLGKEPKWWMWVLGIPLVLIILGIVDTSGIYIPGVHEVIRAVAGGALANIDLNVSSETVQVGIAVVVIVALPLAILAWMVFSGDK